MSSHGPVRLDTTDVSISGSAVAGQNSTFLPHKGVLSAAEKALYVSYSDGAGPYDGTNVGRFTSA